MYTVCESSSVHQNVLYNNLQNTGDAEQRVRRRGSDNSPIDSESLKQSKKSGTRNVTKKPELNTRTEYEQEKCTADTTQDRSCRIDQGRAGTHRYDDNKKLHAGCWPVLLEVAVDRSVYC